MERSFVIVDYLRWHYSVAFKDIVVIWMNVAWFIVHFFSVALLIRTLFAPWKRMSETYKRTGFEDLAATAILNLLSRLVGASIRLVIIISGCILLVLAVLLLLAFFIVWVTLPPAALYLFLYGVTLLL